MVVSRSVDRHDAGAESGTGTRSCRQSCVLLPDDIGKAGSDVLAVVICVFAADGLLLGSGLVPR